MSTRKYPRNNNDPSNAGTNPFKLGNEYSSYSFIQGSAIHVDCSSEREHELNHFLIESKVFQALHGHWKSSSTAQKNDSIRQLI